jgi:hypothetical protein
MTMQKIRRDNKKPVGSEEIHLWPAFSFSVRNWMSSIKD